MYVVLIEGSLVLLSYFLSSSSKEYVTLKVRRKLRIAFRYKVHKTEYFNILYFFGKLHKTYFLRWSPMAVHRNKLNFAQFTLKDSF